MANGYLDLLDPETKEKLLNEMGNIQGDTEEEQEFQKKQDFLDFATGLQKTFGSAVGDQTAGRGLEQMAKSHREKEPEKDNWLKQQVVANVLGGQRDVAKHKLSEDLAEKKHQMGLEEISARTDSQARLSKMKDEMEQLKYATQGEDKLRKERYKTAEEFRIARTQRDKILESAAAGDHAGDLAMVFAFMKMLDPGSVVRESEQASARGAANVYEQLQGLKQRLATTEGMLTPSQRQRFTSLAKEFYELAEKDQRRSDDFLRGIAQRRGLNVENIIPDNPFGDFEDKKERVAEGQSQDQGENEVMGASIQGKPASKSDWKSRARRVE